MFGKQIRASLYGVPPYSFTKNTTVLGGIAPDIFTTIVRHYEAVPVLRAAKLQFSLNKDGSVGGSLGEVHMHNVIVFFFVYNALLYFAA